MTLLFGSKSGDAPEKRGFTAAKDEMMKDSHWLLPDHIARMPNLTGNEKILYAYLLTCPEATQQPNTQNMAEACGVDKTTTLLAIKRLERAKLLKIQRTNARKLKRMVEIQVLDGKSSPSRRSKAKK